MYHLLKATSMKLKGGSGSKVENTNKALTEQNIPYSNVRREWLEGLKTLFATIFPSTHHDQPRQLAFKNEELDADQNRRLYHNVVSMIFPQLILRSIFHDVRVVQFPSSVSSSDQLLRLPTDQGKHVQANVHQ